MADLFPGSIQQRRPSAAAAPSSAVTESDLSGLPDVALSIRQPWAWAIMNAGKDVENRSWSTKFRGAFCIHAAKGMTNAEFDAAVDWMAVMGLLPSGVPDRTSLLRGGIIGTAEIAHCSADSGSPWFMGTYAFELRNVVPVPFIPVKGDLNFFRWRNQVTA